MIPSGKVEGGKGKIGQEYQYIQFLVVIQEEVQAYKDFGPETAVIFALPAQAKDYGIGFSRHYAKKLADRLCPPDFPFCLMMDDSVQYWNGVTLPDDALKPFGDDADTGAKPTAKLADISLADVLLHFQTGLLDVTKDVRNFGIIGFHRLNGRDNSKRAYKRTHCTSTVILNLERLKGVDYLKRAWVWEDLEFNRDAEDKGRVICKCYRFAFSSPQLREGGCANMVARPDAPLDPMLQEPSAVAAAPRLPLGGMESVDSVKPFRSWCKSEVADFVRSIGSAFADMANQIDAHGIGGDFFLNMLTDNDEDLTTSIAEGGLGFSRLQVKLVSKEIEKLGIGSG
jgi:hypothetical protein